MLLATLVLAAAVAVLAGSALASRSGRGAARGGDRKRLRLTERETPIATSREGRVAGAAGERPLRVASTQDQSP